MPKLTAPKSGVPSPVASFREDLADLLGTCGQTDRDTWLQGQDTEGQIQDSGLSWWNAHRRVHRGMSTSNGAH